MCAGGALRKPLLYLSLFFKTHRQTYYDLLTHVRITGDWERWLEFFLTGVKETSDQAVDSARRILTLLDADRAKIETLGRPAASALRVFQYAQKHPILSVTSVARETGISFPTASDAVEHMRRLGLMQEVTGKRRKRLFAYHEYLAILSEGTEPLP